MHENRILTEKECETTRQLLYQTRARNERALSQLTAIEDSQKTLIALISKFDAAMKTGKVFSAETEDEKNAFRSVVDRQPFRDVEAIYRKIAG